MLKLVIIKSYKKHSITSRYYAVTYYQTLEDVPWLLRMEKPKKWKKLSKKFQSFINFKVFKNAVVLLPNPRGSSVTSRADKNSKNDKNCRKNLKIVKNRKKLRVFEEVP